MIRYWRRFLCWLSGVDWTDVPSLALAAPGPQRVTVFPRHRGRPDCLANTGGPRSRVVSTPVISQALSEGSECLGLTKLGDYSLPPAGRDGPLRALALKWLQQLGFGSADEAWEDLARDLPQEPALVVDTRPAAVKSTALETLPQRLRSALVLGKCCGALFRPDGPVIWSERRLARSVRLVRCEPALFTRNDDD